MPYRSLTDASFGLSQWKNCAHCHDEFYGRRNVKFCSPLCQQAERNETRREWRQWERENRQGKLPERTCEHCRGPMQVQRASRRYCSNRCRQAAHRARANRPVRQGRGADRHPSG
jgi:hypothetical protein